MKTTNYILSFCLGSLLVLSSAGCHKKAAELAHPKTLEEGVAQLQAVLATASPQAQSNFYNGLAFGIRYGDSAKALAALQQIASDPSLTDQQKKLVSDVSDLFKQSVAGQPNKAAPAH